MAEEAGPERDVTASIDLRTPTDPARPPADEMLPGLLGLSGVLTGPDAGLRGLYALLDRVVELYGVHDAVIVLADTPIGRQAFRRRGDGRPSPQLRRALASGPPGLYLHPPVEVGPAAGSYVADLCATALRLDLFRHAASTDPLTGLLNRRSYGTALVEAISRTRRYGWPFALVVIDLDNFKAINDRYGHAAGDEALRIIGREIRGVLRQGDVAARLGGDEFALIVANADSPEALVPLTDRLSAALERSVPEPGLHFSVGVACFPDDAADGERLEAIADERMYRSKAAS